MTAPAADLLAHVAADLRGCTLTRTGTRDAVIEPAGGPAFRVEVHVERRRLLQLQTLVVVLDGVPLGHVGADGATGATDDGSDDGSDAEVAATKLVLQHTGQLRRAGLRIVERPVRPGPWPVRRRGAMSRAERAGLAAVAERLRISQELTTACLPLDFTSFEVTVEEGRPRARIELMGGSHVRTTLPPSQSYVRLAPDQVAALLGTVAVVSGLLPAVTPGAGGDGEGLQAARPSAADATSRTGTPARRHLPSRRPAPQRGAPVGP